MSKEQPELLLLIALKLPHTSLTHMQIYSVVCTHTHTHALTDTQTYNTSAISRGELRTQRQGVPCRAEHIQLAPGSPSPLPIVIASHFNIAQRCAANALLTHQRAAANPHSSLEPHSYVTAVPG